MQDSPVFNYISSLSPIKPVRSIHIAQTFHSLSFSSLPSVFTSPHVSTHKESRFLRRNCCSDASRLELPSGTGTKVCSDEGLVVDVGDLYDNSADPHGNFNNAVSIGEGSVEQSSEHLKYEIELPRTLKYDCSNPETDPTLCYGTQMDGASELAGTSTSLEPFLEEVSQRISHETCQIEQKKDVSECDWESLISDAADLLIFNSPIVTEGLKGLMQHSLDRAVGFCTSLNDVEKMQTINPISYVEQHEMGDPSSTQPGETIVKQDVAANDNSQLEYMISNSSGQVGTELEASITVDSKAVSNLHRGLRRRCLDFEMVGTRRKNSDSGSTSSSCTQVQSEAKIMSKDGQLVLAKSGCDSSKHVLPGIGLHLNALAIASRDSKNKKRETAPSARTFPTTTASLPSAKTAQEYNGSLALVPSKTEIDPTEIDVLLDEDVSQASGHLVSEDPNHGPKKKRRRVEGNIEGCKRCNCKKSKCLKLYCECFAAGVYCIEPCSCQECFNKPIHEDTVLATRKQIESRNPLAFAPKVIRNSESAPEIGEEPSKTPASARHKRGCNCKKSNCLKKYCECYQGGVGCSINCRCEGCKNAFGRKDGSAVMENETETEAETEDGTEAREKNGLDRISEKTEILNNEEQNPNSTLPATPLQFCRSLVQMPFSSKSKPPRSFLSIGSSSALYTSQKYGKPNILRPTTTTTTRFEKQFQSVPDEDIPEVLRGDQSPSTVIKTSSPNGKRISPHIGSSPGQRSSRKLILQSIPSFPSLTPHH